MTMEVKHQVFSLESVMQYFARGLQFPNGKRLFSHTYYVDPTKGKVVLEMIVEEFPISAGEEVELVGTDDAELAAIVADGGILVVAKECGDKEVIVCWGGGEKKVARTLLKRAS